LIFLSGDFEYGKTLKYTDEDVSVDLGCKKEETGDLALP
jgi:hypothetical protein